jgi:hypothetical protein
MGHRARHSGLTKKCLRILVLSLVLLSLFVLLVVLTPHLSENLQSDETSSEGAGAPDAVGLPPLYHAYMEAERKLPQHDLALPFPEGHHAKYLWAANHASGTSSF